MCSTNVIYATLTRPLVLGIDCVGINKLYALNGNVWPSDAPHPGVGVQLLQAAIYQPGGDQNVARHTCNKRACACICICNCIPTTPVLHTDILPLSTAPKGEPFVPVYAREHHMRRHPIFGQFVAFQGQDHSKQALPSAYSNRRTHTRRADSSAYTYRVLS